MVVTLLRERLKGVQDFLSFEHWDFEDYPEFATKRGLGRIALLAAILSALCGIHAVFFVQLSIWRWNLFQTHFQDSEVHNVFSTVEGDTADQRWVMAWQWCAYGVALTAFHLLEFFVTAVGHPRSVTSDSFLVNHSAGYTAAALTSWTEFVIRLVWLSKWNWPFLTLAGMLMVLVGQLFRSLAMITAGQSFHHYIQTRRQSTHLLITHGIYHYFRHPSYFGFYYWSIGTQVMLGNLVHAGLFAIILWHFFQRRILYEEESLCQFFPNEYQAYARRTWIGIPFLQPHPQIRAAATASTSTSTAPVVPARSPIGSSPGVDRGGKNRKNQPKSTTEQSLLSSPTNRSSAYGSLLQTGNGVTPLQDGIASP